MTALKLPPVLLFAIFCLLFSSPAMAAEFYFGSHGQEVAVGQTFEVGVFLNTEGQFINAFEGAVAVPSDRLEVSDVREGGSIVSVWIEKPHVVNHEVVFSGIIPGGYAGERGYLFSMILRARAAGEATITTHNNQVLLHDGTGTAAALRISPLVVRIKETGIVPALVLPIDTEPPESFAPEIARDPGVFEGRWFLVFAAQDKRAGIDRYEVQENTRQKIENKKWTVAESPYVLQDQKLRSFVYVKAVDKAGNERIAVAAPRYPLPWYARPEIWGIILLGGVITYVIVSRMARNYRKKRRI